MLISKGISLKDKKQPGKSRNISFFFSMAYIVLFLLLLFCSLFPSHLKEPQPQKVSIQSEWQMDGQPVSLPLYLDGLSPRTLVTLTAQMRINPGDSLYLKTVYAPLQVFADGELIFEYGKPGSFQKFWLDPPTKTALIPLPFKGGTVTLTMCFESPSQRNTLALHPVITGPSAAVWEYLFSEMGFSLFFSIVLIALGVILCLIAFILTRFEQTGISFFWLGLFALCVGIWILGECNLTGLFIQNPVLLYVMAFGGLFTLSVPLLRFIQVVLELPRHKLLNGMLFLMRISLCAAFLLQVSGVASLSKTLYFFHVLILLFFCLLCGLVWSEAIRHKSIAARRLFLPIAVLTVSVILELSNYYMHFANLQKSFLFQIGLLFFIIMLSIVGGYFMREVLALRATNRQLSYEVFLMEKQVEVQKQRHQVLSETFTQLRQQRHDLKHHLAVIRRYLDSRELGKIEEYLTELSSKIPIEPLSLLCENEAVNAVALYYQAAAHKAGVTSCTILLDIPRDTGNILESDLCVIVGNLLENAVTACQGAKQPFIQMFGRFNENNGILTITLDNRVAEVCIGPGHIFLSSKPGGGIGLSSVSSIAEKYHGGSRFWVEDGVFFSSVYLQLKPLS